MSIVDILSDPTSKKRKQSFENEQPTKRSKTMTNESQKPFKSFSIPTTTKFQKKLQHLINNPTNKRQSFKSIGVCRELCIATKRMSWTIPTKIQKESIPHILLGKDLIALAQTGSGKTGAFAIPIIQSLLSSPISHHSLIISPTRELALQIHEQFEELGTDIGLKCIALIGGVDRVQQAMKLQQKQHVIIGTPGRILDHLITCKGFKLFNLKFLVLDEADRILQSEFASAIEQIIKLIKSSKSEHQLKLITSANQNEDLMDKHNYQTLLFSATMTKKVERLEKASLRTDQMIKIEVNTKYQTVATLSQYYLFVPAKHKLVYIVYLLNNIFNDRSIIVFTNTKKSCHHLSLVLHNLNLTVIPLHGEMTQYERMGAIEKFKQGSKSILVATDVAARGLDIPIVTVIVNYDIPIHSKDYIHRVGRTARAGKMGKAVNIITQYDVEIFQRIEQLINIKMEKYPNIEIGQVMTLLQRVIKADRVSKMQIKEHKDEIKLRIKELNKRKSKKKVPQLQVKEAIDSDDENNKFIMDDIDYEQGEERVDERRIGPKQNKTNFNVRNVLKNEAWKKHQRQRGRGRGRGRRGRGRGRGRFNRRRAQSFDSMKDYKKSWKF